jgi:uncharacterized protein DUF6152
MKSRIVAAGVLATLLFAVTLVAHHSNAAQFDSTKRVTMKGEVTKIEWTNPHAYIYVNVRDAAGKVVNYSLEGFPPNTLLRTGWSQKDLKQGDMISFEGCVSRDGSPNLLAREITLADGAKKWWGPMQ